MRRIPILVIASVCALPLAAQTPPGLVSAKMVITLGHFYGKTAPVLAPGDLVVTEKFEPLTVVGLTALRGERAGLEMYVLVDHCSDCEPGSKIAELRQFIQSQPDSTAIGIAYIQEGRLKIAQEPTRDRQSAIKALSPPAGGQASNPFGALAELIRTWKPSESRRAVLMISTGVDPAQREGERNASAEAAIEAAQRGKVTIFGFYHPTANYLQADTGQQYAGQVQLAHVAQESGGEAYFLNFGPLPSLAPFLDDVAEHLANQYLIEFLTSPGLPSGELREISIKPKNNDIELLAPDRAWIPGTAAPSR